MSNWLGKVRLVRHINKFVRRGRGRIYFFELLNLSVISWERGKQRIVRSATLNQ